MTQGAQRDDFPQADDLLSHRHPAALAVVTPTGRIVYWNRAAERLFGLGATEVQGRSLEDVVVPAERRTEYRDAQREALKSGSACYVTERQARDGTRIAARVSLDVAPDSSGAAEAVIVTTWPLRSMRCLCGIDQGGEIEKPLAELTVRQQQVLRHIAEGRSTKDIALKLGLSAKTVETHRVHLMQRLRLRSLAGLVRYAISVGLVPVNPWTTRGGAAAE